MGEPISINTDCGVVLEFFWGAARIAVSFLNAVNLRVATLARIPAIDLL